MSDFVVAQAVGEYVGLSSIVENARQTWTLLVNRASDLDFTTWLIIGGAALLIAVLFGLRPPQ